MHYGTSVLARPYSAASPHSSRLPTLLPCVVGCYARGRSTAVAVVAAAAAAHDGQEPHQGRGARAADGEVRPRSDRPAPGQKGRLPRKACEGAALAVQWVDSPGGSGVGAWQQPTVSRPEDLAQYGAGEGEKMRKGRLGCRQFPRRLLIAISVCLISV